MAVLLLHRRPGETGIDGWYVRGFEIVVRLIHRKVTYYPHVLAKSH